MAFKAAATLKHGISAEGLQSFPNNGRLRSAIEEFLANGGQESAALNLINIGNNAGRG
jgi:hypothetical protein